MDDGPGVVGAAGVEDVEGVGPGEQVREDFGKDVGFIADDEEGVEGHAGRLPNG